MISAPPSRSLLRDDERAADVDADLLVERREVELRDRREVHPAGGVHDDVDAAEGLGDPVEGPLDGLLVGDVGLDGDRVLAGLLDRGARLGLVARVVDDDGVAIGREPPDDRAADAARALMPAGTLPRPGIAVIEVEDFTVPLVLLWPAGRPSAAVDRLIRALSG